MFACAVLAASCATSDHAIPSAPSAPVGAMSQHHQQLRDDYTPNSGCNYYADGTTVCATSCVGTQFGSYNSMTCDVGTVTGPAYSANPGWIGDPVGSGGGGYGGNPPPDRSLLSPAQAVWDVAERRKCTVGSGNPGNGCAIALNRIFQAALGHSIPPNANYTCNWFPTTPHTCKTIWVPDLVQAMLLGGYATQVTDQYKTVAGDIVVQDGGDPVNGMNHIGICQWDHCAGGDKAVLSNSGSTAKFCGETNVTMSNPGYGYPSNQTPTFYHITH